MRSCLCHRKSQNTILQRLDAVFTGALQKLDTERSSHRVDCDVVEFVPKASTGTGLKLGNLSQRSRTPYVIVRSDVFPDTSDRKQTGTFELFRFLKVHDRQVLGRTSRFVCPFRKCVNKTGTCLLLSYLFRVFALPGTRARKT